MSSKTNNDYILNRPRRTAMFTPRVRARIDQDVTREQYLAHVGDVTSTVFDLHRRRTAVESSEPIVPPVTPLNDQHSFLLRYYTSPPPVVSNMRNNITCLRQRGVHVPPCGSLPPLPIGPLLPYIGTFYADDISFTRTAYTMEVCGGSIDADDVPYDTARDLYSTAPSISTYPRNLASDVNMSFNRIDINCRFEEIGIFRGYPLVVVSLLSPVGHPYAYVELIADYGNGQTPPLPQLPDLTTQTARYVLHHKRHLAVFDTIGTVRDWVHFPSVPQFPDIQSFHRCMLRQSVPWRHLQVASQQLYSVPDDPTHFGPRRISCVSLVPFEPPSFAQLQQRLPEHNLSPHHDYCYLRVWSLLTDSDLSNILFRCGFRLDVIPPSISLETFVWITSRIVQLTNRCPSVRLTVVQSDTCFHIDMINSPSRYYSIQVDAGCLSSASGPSVFLPPALGHLPDLQVHSLASKYPELSSIPHGVTPLYSDEEPSQARFVTSGPWDAYKLMGSIPSCDFKRKPMLPDNIIHSCLESIRAYVPHPPRVLSRVYVVPFNFALTFIRGNIRERRRNPMNADGVLLSSYDYIVIPVYVPGHYYILV